MRLVLLAALLLTACGAAYGSAGAGGASASPSASPVTASITIVDNGGTLTVRVGDRVQIALGDQYEWTLDPPDGVVLTHPVQNYMLVRGTQAIWLASAAGTSTIHASAPAGAASCPVGYACQSPRIAFVATVVVVP